MSQTGQSSRFSIPSELQADIQVAQQAVQEYQRTGQIPALDQAVSVWEGILQSSAFQGTEPDFRLAVMDLAGQALLSRYRAQGREEDLEQALKWTQQAVDLTPEGSPDKASHLNNLGNRLSARYNRSGDLADLEAAIQASH